MEKFPTSHVDDSQSETVEKESLKLNGRAEMLAEAESIEITPSDRNIEGALLAGNGEVSKLSELEWKIVRTESFKRWFGDSMVVDDNGEPLLLYHGSPKRFDAFDLAEAGSGKDSGYFGTGFYFTPHKALAEKYGPVLYKTFLKIEHVQVFSEEHGNVRYDEKALPENVRQEVLRRYDPLREREYRRLKKRDDE